MRGLGQRGVECRGSPPRVWGRFFASTAALTSSTVHPHVCGDDELYTIRIRYRSRFTPTCVGTILEHRPNADVDSVHPHVCGDDVVGL